MTHDEIFLFVIGVMVMLFIIIYIVANIFFILSIQKTLRLIPKTQQNFPSWFCWLMLIPLVGFVFSWLMIPFGIPDAIQSNQAENPQGLAGGKRLFGLGLSTMILMTISPFLSILGILTFVPMLVLWILYWVNIVSIRKMLQVSATEA